VRERISSRGSNARFIFYAVRLGLSSEETTAMTLASSRQAKITRTERGLTIAGTRITLYQFMDYIHAGHSSQSFRHYFPQITNEQFDAAISYIDANLAEVESEYQIVLKQAEENRHYWEERNREYFTPT
jgi:uncharacterized protein (DUF433 family)